MKKHNTFKVVLGAMLIFAILSWIIPAAYYSNEFVDQGLVQVGLFDLFNYSLTSVSYFGYLALYVIFVGGFYGVLNKIPAYRSMLDAITKKVYGKEKVVLSVIMILLAAIVSVWGIEVEVLLFVPFLVSLILLMGFDKMVAALAIAGSSLVGVAGSTFAYGNVGILLQILNLDIQSDIYVKLVILLVGLVLLIFNTLLYIKKSTKAAEVKEEKTEEVVAEEVEEEVVVATKIEPKKTTKKQGKSNTKATAKKSSSKKSTKSSKSKNDNKAAVKDDEVIVVKNVETEDVKGLIPEKMELQQKVWPLAVTFILLVILMLFAFLPWTSAFEIKWFEEASVAVGEFKLFGFPLFAKIFGTYNPFGAWSCTDYLFPLMFFTLILALIYRVKLSELFEGFGEGAKKALAPAGMIIVLYTILVLVTYHPFQLTIYKAILGLSKGFNIATATVVAMLSGLFNSDMAYTMQSILPYFTSVVTNTEVYSAVAVLFQSVYAITMLVVPTSLVLMVVLTYLDIPYTKWLKNVWKFVLEFLVLSIVVTLIIVLL